MQQIRRINHVGLRVRSLATARQFYEKLGFEFIVGPIGPEPVAVMRDYLAGLPGQGAADALSGRMPAAMPNPGPVLCSCFGTGINTIIAAIETDGLMSVEAIGEALGAGTNCGSCRPELSQLLARSQMKEAAE